MFNGEILNAQLMRVIGEMGHTDMLCVCDAGLPIPKEVERVDLAWKKDIPGWFDVCATICKNMVVEKIYLAEEMVKENTEQYERFKKHFEGIEIVLIPHEELKSQSRDCRAVIRTGEFSSYCNCIFVSGVNF